MINCVENFLEIRIKRLNQSFLVDNIFIQSLIIETALTQEKRFLQLKAWVEKIIFFNEPNSFLKNDSFKNFAECRQNTDWPIDIWLEFIF